ncbi:MAG TPA: Gfo/Idh/MocA family oxidoreductase [Planctomycetota bacterium]|jgi:glucose-fructose oxidoreductase|nr:Gfo/Idh/MocA family oxidoreductase [Planctomycetota bacterium]HJP01772.1 Gfo/Idh/MocA family oxidoreductase [Planctomycetota bacterium]
MKAPWKIVGINFDHMHMGDNLRFAHDHPGARIVGLCDEDPARMKSAVEAFGLSTEQVFTDLDECLDATRPDLAVLCPATARHADWVARVAAHRVHVMLEKPFAANLADADRMIADMRAAERLFAVNWPLAWYPPHVTARRLIDEGLIGEVIEAHYHDGNRGPLWHLADKQETDAEFVQAQKATSWWYSREAGGGSQLDYLGYGATLGTWFLDGRAPIEVTSVVDEPAGLEVDEHSVTVARYEFGLSRFETRWGTFTDPWTHQPQPKCGFEIVGTDGTISSYDYETTVRMQTREHPEGVVLPVDAPRPPMQNPIQYLLDCLESGRAVEGPLAPELSRIGQQIVDSAVLSAREKRTVALLG